jgi:hypothetical protein
MTNEKIKHITTSKSPLPLTFYPWLKNIFIKIPKKIIILNVIFVTKNDIFMIKSPIKIEKS